ncbi:LysR substrate-binding domain-containing protein [Burkholderia oklahomensis]|uniref:Bacterial regulatory helix-turn-helix, lysR family protein n=1 Tax=Burkholderia oklahomensis TaxID=342113 RepID=A0AAI8FPR9_9BURK|nr:LysR substrate-binding domain-containing protein [Burkholderia oklahomensis]AIO68220.1 bacterial regulatory helix-turn-helix, lysR family protein [Burkholderia oklahomensis]AJX32294.1 bacterial regulatory helix-turn-helix, lysR family protein [Burkholderia oklahomensis C6786]AOI42806.1 LysR family transcriptional regulator [Burkholderia oklahomensis EO147]AOI46295.1 LysR family transcriptional regulator [Burkholderia oklahomensis C6786]KUY53947.1 LysR family transcriptional regulator [Burkh
MRISPLPPLQCLIAFEASVRHASFTRAASELNLTQSAISRQIGQLEEFLGRALFLREPRALRLTVAGERYAERIRALLEECSEATFEIMKRYGDLDLAVACSAGVGTLWLTPRLSSFCSAHPNINLRLIVRDSLASLAPSEFDVGLYYLRDRCESHLDSQLLIDEEVFPVCSPDYLGGRLLSPAELVEETLLTHEDRQRPWMSWDEWLELNGVAMPKKRRIIVANHYPQLVQMAVYGQGLVLGWNQMIDHYLETRQLVRATRESATNGGGYYIVTPNERSMKRAVALFKRWLTQQSAPNELLISA